MKAIVTSDVHLGSRALDPSDFIAFLGNLPEDDQLVLNGDIVNRNCDVMPERHAQALSMIRDISKKRRVIWIRGNHDESYELDDPGDIEFVDFSHIEDGVGILHGHDFRHRKLRNRPLVYTLRAIQVVRRNIVTESAAVHYKVWNRHILVRILRRHIINNAFALARELNLHTVICGHIHINEVIEKDGVRYINTGSWVGSHAKETKPFQPWVTVSAGGKSNQ